MTYLYEILRQEKARCYVTAQLVQPPVRAPDASHTEYNHVLLQRSL